MNEKKVAEADVVIIGAGITGCGIARELSKYKVETKIDKKNLGLIYQNIR